MRLYLPLKADEVVNGLSDKILTADPLFCFQSQQGNKDWNPAREAKQLHTQHCQKPDVPHIPVWADTLIIKAHQDSKAVDTAA